MSKGPIGSSKVIILCCILLVNLLFFKQYQKNISNLETLGSKLPRTMKCERKI